MKIIAFGASTSSQSINKRFATYTAGLFDDFEIEILDLNDFEVPIFNVDREKKSGIPDLIKGLYQKMIDADLLIISMTEHNGSYSAAFKNTLDWLSRYKSEFWEGKNMLLLSTSPGKRGGQFVMEASLTRFPIHGAKILQHFSLPSFYDNFDDEKGILNDELKQSYFEIIQKVKSSYGMD